MSVEANRVSVLKCPELHHIQQITVREGATALSMEVGEAAAAVRRLKSRQENILGTRTIKRSFRGSDEC